MARKAVADKVVSKVQIRIDGKDWPIVVTHNVIIECEDLTGLNLLTGAETNFARPSAKLVRGLLFLCLKRAGAEYSLEEVGDLITPANIVMVQEGLIKAWAASMPDVEEEPNPIQAVR